MGSRLEPLRYLAFGGFLFLWVWSGLASASETERSKALGYGALPFSAPRPGSYQLSSLGPSAEGEVLDAEGRPLKLGALLGQDKLTLLSFIYSSCEDANGCPLAISVMMRLQNKLLADDQLGKKVRFVTISFDPEKDTPDRMRAFGSALRKSPFEWHFLTTASKQQLAPLLEHYQQGVQEERGAEGRSLNQFSHLLRLYLIDAQGLIRNIYTVSTLHPDLILSDLETLRLERPEFAPAKPSVTEVSPSQRTLEAGDDKKHYENPGYVTHSQSLPSRKGQAMDFMALIKHLPLGLPELSPATRAALSGAKIALGRKLFFDRRLSHNNTFSCAMCHIPEQGFTSQEQATAIGVEGRTVRRNAPTLYNVGYRTKLFHDGRDDRLEDQVWGPLLSHNEMANPSIGTVVQKIKGLKDYRGLFEAAYGKGVGIEVIGDALASYERVLLSGDSDFDRWHFAGKSHALSLEAQRGFAIFVGKGGCSGCHTLSVRSALFSDQDFHDTGIGYQASMEKDADPIGIQVAPGVSFKVEPQTLSSISEPKPNDLGRYEITQKPEDRWRYLTPSLRNIALTAPYMHDGSLSTLREVIQFYNLGGVAHEGQDPSIHPLHLTPEECSDLEAFLHSLTGRENAALVRDAWSAPIGEP